MSDEKVWIVFDGPPGPQCGRFVEVENAKGEGRHCGEWTERADGYWTLGPFVEPDQPCSRRRLEDQ